MGIEREDEVEKRIKYRLWVSPPAVVSGGAHAGRTQGHLSPPPLTLHGLFLLRIQSRMVPWPSARERRVRSWTADLIIASEGSGSSALDTRLPWRESIIEVNSRTDLSRWLSDSIITERYRHELLICDESGAVERDLRPHFKAKTTPPALAGARARSVALATVALLHNCLDAPRCAQFPATCTEKSYNVEISQNIGIV
jgi:hypothetical protein